MLFYFTMPQQTLMTKLATHVTLSEKLCVQCEPKAKFRNFIVSNNLPPNKQTLLNAFSLFNAVSDVNILPKEAKNVVSRGVLVVSRFC